MAEAHLLDTSAMLTFIENENGADRVETLLRQPETIVTWVTMVEVYYITLQERSEVDAERRHALIKALPIKFVMSVDESTMLEAARLKARYKISFADAVIGATAISHKATLVHKDREYEQLTGLLKMESLPYK